MSGAVSVAITKRLPGFTLDVSWRAEQSVLGLFGPSGAGKTLTLQCLAGLIRPDAGRIVVGERVFFDAEAQIDLSPQERRIGYVFQGYALFPHLTVVKNIAFGLRGRPRGDRARRTAQIVERLGLGGLEQRYPRELSGGERQRVALCRALVLEPPLLLADEPTGNLDPASGDNVFELLLDLQARHRTTGILVTHNPEIAERCTRIQRLDGGVLHPY
jgi:ABC-type sulfate/molybdate transport systems ATPase subunit